MEYGKITETGAVRIAKEMIEGYKPIVDEVPITGKGELVRIEEREECIARVYEEKSNTIERLNALEEKQSITDGAIEELASLVSGGVSND